MEAQTEREPAREDVWLRRLAGDWSVEAPAPDGEGTIKGRETARLFGNWVVLEGASQMPDASVHSSLMTLGFDPARGKVVGSWVGSMMSHLWVYEGGLDAAGDTLTLATHGPVMDGSGGTADYEDIITFEGEDMRLLTSRQRQPDGTWRDLFCVRYSREG